MGNEYIDLKGMLALELPNLTRRLPTLRKMAQEQGWPYRKRQGRGGGMEYQVAGLPEEIQTAVRERQAEQLLAQSQPAMLPSMAKAKRPVAVRRMEQLGLPIDDYAMGLNDKQRDCAHARMALAAEVLRLHEVTGFGITDAVDFVVRQVESGQLSETLAYLVPVANARANNQRGISVRTLKGWVAAYRAAGSPNARLAALAPRPTKTETPVVQIAWLADFMAHHCRPSAPKLAHSYQEFAKGWLTAQPAYELPSLDTVRRVWKKLPQIMQQRGRMTGAAYKSLQPYTTTTMPSGCMCTRWTAALCAKPRWTATNARPCRLRCATSWRKNVPKAESNARKTPSGWRKKKPARPSSNSPTSDYWLAMGTTSPCRRKNLRFLCLKATATNGSGSKRSKTGSLRQQAT